MMKKPTICLAALSLLLAVACKKDEKKDADQEAAAAVGEEPVPLDEIPGPTGNARGTLDTSLLEYVPADSPFVMAMLTPLPQDFLDFMAEGFRPLMSVANMAISAAKEDESIDPLGRALIDEIDGKLSQSGMESLGITLRPRMVFYAIGWSLAMRVELADGKRFSALLDRLEAKSGSAMARAELGGIAYRELVEDEAAFVVAVIGDFVVAGVMHENARDKVLPVLLGLEKPKESMASAGTITAIADKYKLMGLSTGFVDTQAVARMLTGQATGLSKEIMAASNIDLPEFSAVCQQEFSDMAKVVPRAVFGYQSASAKGYESVFGIELRPDLARELAQLQAPSLDLEKLRAGRPMLAMGAAMELDDAVAWMQKTTKRMGDEPYRCEQLREFNESIEELAEELNKPLPAFVRGAHGFALVLKSLEMKGFMPTGEGYAVVGVKDPKALFEKAKQDAPPLANITLSRGEPVDVPLGVPGLDNATLLLEERWLGAAVGKGMAESMTSLLRSKSHAKSPFAFFAYDYKELMKLSQDMDPDGADGMDAQLAEILGDIMGYSTSTMHFTRDGVLLRLETDTTGK